LSGDGAGDAQDGPQHDGIDGAFVEGLVGLAAIATRVRSAIGELAVPDGDGIAAALAPRDEPFVEALLGVLSLAERVEEAMGRWLDGSEEVHAADGAALPSPAPGRVVPPRELLR
jgi:hypothetical protein